ncbi:hypothetical protein ATEIFO6365_0005036500 [Aspergillus terreus]|uniref:Uncharacterized protein n=1 Tax=Aspergillus terreus TaxID=33178 RepID=A0A5M3Z299_ASPTE|nr:hypothetical protein ATETN484_0007037000 [Aspergillus terreus]GFF16175.1 hypothetical protein ATEIFO6365_0005036500 [Aspergillus terreus]
MASSSTVAPASGSNEKVIHSTSIHNVDIVIYNRVDPDYCGELTALDFIPREKRTDLGELFDVSLLKFSRWETYLKSQCAFNPELHLVRPLQKGHATLRQPTPIHSREQWHRALLKANTAPVEFEIVARKSIKRQGAS